MTIKMYRSFTQWKDVALEMGATINRTENYWTALIKGRGLVGKWDCIKQKGFAVAE